MQSMWGRIIGCIAWLALGCGCAAMRDGRRVAATQPGAAAYPSQREVEVGEIALVRVNPRPFVLIRCGSPVVLPRKAPLECRAAAAVNARLSLSPERSSEYIVADILSGSPSKGDRVFYVFPGSSGEVETTTAIEMSAPVLPGGGTAHADFDATPGEVEPASPENPYWAEDSEDDAWLERWAESIEEESDAPENDPFLDPALPPADEPRDVEWR